MGQVRTERRDKPRVDVRVFLTPGAGSQPSLFLSAPILNELCDPVVALDEGNRITYCNPAAERFYGFAAAQVQGQPFGETTGCDWPPAPQTIGEEARRSDHSGW